MENTLRNKSHAPILELLIATANPGKVKEIRDALDGLPLKLRELEEFPNIAVPDESGESYAENAVIKAQAYADQTGLTALADDSGLEVAALDGAPGLISARFGGAGVSDAERTALLLSRLSSVEMEKRRAQFICVVALAQPVRGVVNIETGKCRGTITKTAKGNLGFGFDPIFIPDGYQITFAQMPSALKNKISHRAKALTATRQFLAEQLQIVR